MLSAAFQPRGGTVALPLGQFGFNRLFKPININQQMEMGRPRRRIGFGFEFWDIIGFILDPRGRRRGTRMERVLKAIINFYGKGREDFPRIYGYYTT